MLPSLGLVLLLRGTLDEHRSRWDDLIQRSHPQQLVQLRGNCLVAWQDNVQTLQPAHQPLSSHAHL